MPAAASAESRRPNSPGSNGHREFDLGAGPSVNPATLSQIIGRCGRLELLCPEEPANLHLDPRGAELLL